MRALTIAIALSLAGCAYIDKAVPQPDGSVKMVRTWQTGGMLRDLIKRDSKTQTIAAPYARITCLWSDTIIEVSNAVITTEVIDEVQSRSTTAEIGQVGLGYLGLAVNAWDKGKP